MSTETSGRKKTYDIDLGGRTYAAEFDFLAFSYAETAYEETFGVKVNVADIIEDLLRSRARAVMAFAWGGIKSAGTHMSFGTFSKLLNDFDTLGRVTEVVAQAVVDSMPEVDSVPTEDNSKNVPSRGE